MFHRTYALIPSCTDEPFVIFPLKIPLPRRKFPTADTLLRNGKVEGLFLSPLIMKERNQKLNIYAHAGVEVNFLFYRNLIIGGRT
jgi:hypothetical protein